MADIFQEVEEDIRRDRYEQLAKKYGGLVLGAMVLAVAGTGGYVYWKNSQVARDQAETLALSTAVDVASAAVSAAPAPPAAPPAVGATAAPGLGGASGPAVLDRLALEAKHGPAGLARFYAAGLRARAGDGAGAIAGYEMIAADGSVSPLYRDLATLMTIQLQVGTGDPAALRARLEALTAATNPWRYSARELSALLMVRAGDKAGAKTLFKQLADDIGAPAGLRARAAELAAFYGKS